MQIPNDKVRDVDNKVCNVNDKGYNDDKVMRGTMHSSMRQWWLRWWGDKGSSYNKEPEDDGGPKLQKKIHENNICTIGMKKTQR